MSSDNPSNASGENTPVPTPAKVTQATRRGAQQRPSDEPWPDISAAEDESAPPGDDTSGTQDGAAGIRKPRTRDPAILCAHLIIVARDKQDERRATNRMRVGVGCGGEGRSP